MKKIDEGLWWNMIYFLYIVKMFSKQTEFFLKNGGGNTSVSWTKLGVAISTQPWNFEYFITQNPAQRDKTLFSILVMLIFIMGALFELS